MKTQKIRNIGVAAFIAATAFGLTAASAEVYDFSFIGVQNYTVTGTFTTDAGNTIISGSGSVLSNSGLYPSGAWTLATPTSVGNVDGQAWDNIFNPGANAFAGNGIGLDIGGRYATIYNTALSGYGNCGLGNNCFSYTAAGSTTYNLYDPGDVAASFSVTAVPEPAVWAMLLVGFFGVGFMMRGSRTKQSAAATA